MVNGHLIWRVEVQKERREVACGRVMLPQV
jgi:hypothetical protein